VSNKSKERKIRLDIALYKQKLAHSIEEAKIKILSGKVLSEGRKYDNPSQLVSINIKLSIKKPKSQYVSRGGDKLYSVIKGLNLESIIKNKVILDIGASTGGFTDCLLSFNVKKVIAIDVGYNQFSWSLRKHEKVVCLEKTDIRDFCSHEYEEIQFVVADISFNSLSRLSAAIAEVSAYPHLDLLLLVKPQFELKREDIPYKGVVEDESLQKKAVKHVVDSFYERGFYLQKEFASLIKGRRGNQEFFILLKRKT
jgi:23S rRNA (cytidine1920-2'-O)/16S rRNA (cytidine1409-2'-O)-methyltransferase